MFSSSINYLFMYIVFCPHSSNPDPSTNSQAHTVESSVAGRRPRARSQSELILGDPPPFLREADTAVEADQQAVMDQVGSVTLNI